MKQVIRKGLKEIIVDEVADPMVIPHHVLIRPFYSLISSGTETASIHTEGVLKEVSENPSHLQKIMSVMKDKGPIRTAAEVYAKFSEYAVLGYSGAGVIADKHASVTDLEIGDRVSYGGEGTGHAETVLAGRNLVARVPPTVSLEHACFTTLGSIALNALRTASIGMGEVVAVIGLGLVGQLISQLVKAQGGTVFGIDLMASRVDLAKQLGADYSVIASESTSEVLRTVTNGMGADCVIVAAAAKSASPCVQALEICRDRGRIVVVGAVKISFPWEEMYAKEIKVFMSRAYGPGSYDPLYEKHGQDYPLPYVRWTENRNMGEFIRLVANGQVRVQPLITHQFRLEEAARAYQTILDPSTNSVAVLLRYPSAESLKPIETFEPKRKIEVTNFSGTAKDIRVAVVGAGNLGRWAHLPNLKKTSHVRLHAVYSASGVRGKNYARRFGAAYCTSDYREILSDPELDVVLILSRNQQHCAQAVAALSSGKHVFVEKPMALTEAECRMIYEAVQKSGKQLTVGFNRRFAPLYRELKRHLACRVGPAVLNCRVNSPGISGSYWMADPSIGGAILGEACHFVDLMCWLLNSDPLSVSAYTLPFDSKEPVGQNNMVATLEFEDGSIASLTYCTVGSKRSTGERVEVFAGGITAKIEDFKRLSIKTSQHRTKTLWWAEKGYKAQLKSFVNGVREGNEPEITVRDGARSTIICLRMLESARSHTPRTVEIDRVLTGEEPPNDNRHSEIVA